jgi:hypothetical protein
MNGSSPQCPTTSRFPLSLKLKEIKKNGKKKERRYVPQKLRREIDRKVRREWGKKRT